MKTLEKRLEKLPISLRLTKNQHIDYSAFAGSLILNKDLSNFLSKIDQIIMGSETEPLKVTSLESTLPTKIGMEIIKSTMLEAENDVKNQPDRDIREMMQKHLTEILPYCRNFCQHEKF